MIDLQSRYPGPDPVNQFFAHDRLIGAGIPPDFPIQASANGKYCIDQRGTPFLIGGRVCWMIFRLPRSEYRFVLDDTANKGFNCIEMKTPICPSVDNGDGRDQDGNLPFSLRLDGAAWSGTTTFGNINNEAPDFTTPVEAYWLNNDRFLNECLGRRLLVFYFPAYVGYKDTDWWMNIMAANGQAKMTTYGAYIANRYRNQKNLVWMLGGDQGTGGIPFDADELAAETGLINGLKSVYTVSPFYSAEWLRNSITTDLFASSISLNGCYANSVTDINAKGTQAYAISPPKPAYHQEMPFEESAGVPPAWRRLLWWAFFSTCSGGLFGNGVFTSFDSGVYTSHMNTQGTLDAARQNRYLSAKPWHTLVPTQSAITAGGGTADSETEVRCVCNITAAAPYTGTLLLVYLPPNHTGTVTLDMTKMGGTTLSRWWDPTTATYTADASGLANSGTHVFTRPGNNAAGEADWILELTA